MYQYNTTKEGRGQLSTDSTLPEAFANQSCDIVWPTALSWCRYFLSWMYNRYYPNRA